MHGKVSIHMLSFNIIVVVVQGQRGQCHGNQKEMGAICHGLWIKAILI